MLHIDKSRKNFILKTVLRMMVKKFSIQVINEKLAEIFAEESETLCDYSFDDLAEAYDRINLDIKHKETMQKMRR